ncbi:MAG: type II toxin-antitoxin system ParD family antitoxin [Maricaulis sp.]|jgi:antitoxin ParD1/3/4|uniref:type II toxin-antitoxin system ParD family antitoxin n=1 Tax=Maricaulis sp. TaxID=1486257 RepID=UPI002628CD89|nr:type II toxin-antitoxin system ParD family antitoxin [Maricaulis sp.]MDM7984062.1 type II toxin-antitoxin system ParD family antitoxin [Maricaulis sp.]
MNISLGKRWEVFIQEQVKQGRYQSQSEVVREGLRLVEEREAKLAELKQSIQDAIDRGGSYTIEEVEAHLDSVAEDMKAEGY